MEWRTYSHCSPRFRRHGSGCLARLEWLTYSRCSPTSNTLILFRIPVDPPRWPSLSPVTIRNIDGLPARWDDVRKLRQHETWTKTDCTVFFKNFWQWLLINYWDDCHVELIPRPSSATEIKSAFECENAWSGGAGARNQIRKERFWALFLSGHHQVCMREAARPKSHTLAQSFLTPANAPTASHACFRCPHCILPARDLKAGVCFWPGSFP